MAKKISEILGANEIREGGGHRIFRLMNSGDIVSLIVGLAQVLRDLLKIVSLTFILNCAIMIG